MNNIMINLAKIEAWAEEIPDLSTFKTNDDFMNYAVELMNNSLYILKLGSALAPNSNVSGKGFTKRKAIVTGHMVRITKLYEGLLIHVSKRQLELASIFSRLIFETSARMRYLMRAKPKTFKNFVLTSYRPEKEILTDLKAKSVNRPLISIEQRMRRKIKARLKEDKISIRSLMDNKTWNLDGKDFRKLLQEINWADFYSYGFGSGSHSIHGDWYEISLHHLRRSGAYYFPDLEFDDPDPRISCPLTAICLGLLVEYIKWNKLDPDNTVTPIILRLIEINRQLDISHENTIGI